MSWIATDYPENPKKNYPSSWDILVCLRGYIQRTSTPESPKKRWDYLGHPKKSKGYTGILLEA